MTRRRYRCDFALATLLLYLAILSPSCESEHSGSRDEAPRSKKEEYLETMAAKEVAAIERGWVHVKGSGYFYEKPENWIETQNLEEGEYVVLTSPKNDIKIRLISRYIESIPEGVDNLDDWARLQYSSMGMPEAVKQTREVEVEVGEAVDAWISLEGLQLRVRYLADIFKDSEKQRLWLLYVMTQDESLLNSTETQRLLDSFRIEDFRWLND